MLRKSLLTIFILLLVDQWVKIYIKTHFYWGQEIHVLGDWFRISFIENEGMAWGAKLPFDNAKLILSSFRVVAVAGLGYYLWTLIKSEANRLYIMALSLIFAGALGNVLDSLFYGIMFEQSIPGGPIAKSFLADDFKGGYAGMLYGNVVDMLYFPMFHGKYPEWIPGVGGERFTFFSPIFNIADTAISVGVGIFVVFQKRFFPKEDKEKEDQNVSNASEGNKEVIVSSATSE